MSIRLRHIGFPQRPSEPVSGSRMSFRVGRPPSRQSRVQSLVPCLLFGVPSPFLLVVPLGPTRPAGGLFPLRGVTSGVHSSRCAPAPATFRPQVFSTSRRLSPPSALRACCIPLPRPGFSVQGLLPPSSRVDSSPIRASPPLSSLRSPTRAGCHVETPRPRGFAPLCDAFLEEGV